MKSYLTEKEANNVIDFYLDWRLSNKDEKIPKKDLDLGFKGKHGKKILDELGICAVENETKGFFVTDKVLWEIAKKTKKF